LRDKKESHRINFRKEKAIEYLDGQITTVNNFDFGVYKFICKRKT
jgi:hypothetical protein